MSTTPQAAPKATAPTPSSAPAPPQVRFPAADLVSSFSLPEVKGTATMLDAFNESLASREFNSIAILTAWAVAYQGLDTAALRRDLFSKGLTFEKLIVVLSCVAISGNNPDRLLDSAKVTDVNISRRANAITRELGVTGRRVKDGATVTMARIAICFAPIYYKLREYLHDAGRLQDQFPNTIHPVFQDPNLGAIAVIRGFEVQYRAFEAEFSDAVSGRGAGRPGRVGTDWLAVAVRGMQSDSETLRVMTSADKLTGTRTPQDLLPLFEMYESQTYTDGPITIPALRTKPAVPPSILRAAESK